MTTSGKRLAALVGIAIAAALPKHVECGYPDARCERPGTFHRVCKAYEVEPMALYLIEVIAKQDVGFAYTSGEDCR